MKTQDSLEEPLLSGVSRNENSRDVESAMEQEQPNEEVVVRVVINPSILDRFLRSDYYYFYDDIAIPYETLLVGRDTLLPSQKEKLLSLEGDSPESNLFGHLWLRLCARLAKTRAEYYYKDQFRIYCCVLIWLILALHLVLQIVNSEVYTDELLPLLVPNAICMALVLYPLTMRLSEVTEEQAQSIVDEMGPLFSDEGFYVDLITSSPAMYIRFKTISNSFGSSSSLKETMSRFQMRAQHNHQQSLIAKRQDKLKKSNTSGTLCGIRIDTLLSWQPCVKTITVTIGVFWLFLFGMQMISFDYFWYGLAPGYTRVQRYDTKLVKILRTRSDDISPIVVETFRSDDISMDMVEPLSQDDFVSS